jgi:hypothetical protein
MDPESRHSITHVGAWCDKIPQSAYTALVELSSTSISSHTLRTGREGMNFSYPEPTAMFGSRGTSQKLEQTTQVVLQINSYESIID